MHIRCTSSTSVVRQLKNIVRAEDGSVYPRSMNSLGLTRLQCAILILAVLSGCQLVVEPMYRRDLPEVAVSSDAQSRDLDATSSDGSTTVDETGGGDDVADIDTADVPTMIDDRPSSSSDVYVADPSNRCRPAAVEHCNGVDDNCDGVVDEGSPDLGELCITDRGLRGQRAMGCRCMPQGSAELCGNNIDDDGDGIVDGPGCRCTVFYAATDIAPIGMVSVLRNWSDVLRVPAPAVGPKVVCLMSSGNPCAQTTFNEPITIPANMQVQGGWYSPAAGIAVQGDMNCRPTINAPVSFVGSNDVSALSRVRVTLSGGDSVGAITMNGPGAVEEVTVLRMGSQATGAGIIGNPMAGATQRLTNVNVTIRSAGGTAAGIEFVGGQQFLNNITLALSIVQGNAAGIRLTGSRGASVSNITLASATGALNVSGIELNSPVGPVEIIDFRQSPGPAVTTGAASSVAGLATNCANPMRVNVLGMRWSGGVASGPNSNTFAITNSGCDLLLANTAMIQTDIVGGAAQPGNLGTNVGAISCDRGNCELIGISGRPLLLRGSIGSTTGGATNVAPIRAQGNARVAASDVQLLPNLSTGAAAQGAAGIFAPSANIYIERTVIRPAFSMGGGVQQRGIEWQGGNQLQVRDSLIELNDGVGIRVNAAMIAAATPGVSIVSNTIARGSMSANIADIAIIDVLGTRAPAATFRVMNNILSPHAPNANPGSTFAAVRSVTRQPFSLFTHNLLSEAQPALLLGANSINAMAMLQSELAPVVGAFSLQNANFPAPGDFRITRASPAAGNGNWTAVLNRKDVEGTPRPLHSPDIGAYEILE